MPVEHYVLISLLRKKLYFSLIVYEIQASCGRLVLCCAMSVQCTAGPGVDPGGEAGSGSLPLPKIDGNINVDVHPKLVLVIYICAYDIVI